MLSLADFLQGSGRSRKGHHDNRRHALAMLRIVAVLSSLNCILRSNYLAKYRRAQNALLVSWCPFRPLSLTCIMATVLRQPYFRLKISRLRTAGFRDCCFHFRQAVILNIRSPYGGLRQHPEFHRILPWQRPLPWKRWSHRKADNR